MQRVAAWIVLIAASFSLAKPLLSLPAAEPELPACCRKDGKHRCGMNAKPPRQAHSDGPSVHAAPSRCPLYPAAAPARPLGPSVYSLVPDNASAFSGMAAQSLPALPLLLTSSIDDAFSEIQRGPPAVVLA